MRIENSKLYTPEEVADMLKVKKQTVWKWLRQGILHGVKIGKLWRIPEKDLTEFLEKKKKGEEYEENL